MPPAGFTAHARVADPLQKDQAMVCVSARPAGARATAHSAHQATTAQRASPATAVSMGAAKEAAMFPAVELASVTLGGAVPHAPNASLDILAQPARVPKMSLATAALERTATRMV